MAVQLTVDKLEADHTIRVRHVFFGETIEECERLRDQHGAGCKAFGPALQAASRGDENRIIELAEEICEIPEWEET